MISLIDTVSTDLNSVKNISDTICFVGSQLDQRGRDIVGALEGKNEVFEVSFDADNYTLTIDDTAFGLMRVSSELQKIYDRSDYENILVESTTLGFVEVLLILRWFSKSNLKNVEIIYAEPDEYKLRTNYMNDFGKHEFDLSTHSGGFKAIPGFAKALTQSKKAVLIASVGFERSRIGQLLSLDDGAYIESVIPIYGTPGFQAGWDKHSFFQNVEVLSDKGLKPQFVSANSPIDMLFMLEYIVDSFGDEEITIAPLGTKPLSIASAIFLINNPNVTLKYDHPKKKSSRSKGLGKIHIYSVIKVVEPL